MSKNKVGATVDIANIGSVKASIQKRFNDWIKESGILEIIAAFIMDGIRDGINPDTGKNFKGLETSTIKWRRKVAELNPTHPNYSATKSNLTLSGEFIDSIVAEIIKSENLIVIKPTGSHPGYFGVNGKPTRKGQPLNMDIAKGQKEMGRNILIISKKMRQEILDIVRAEYKKEFNK